MDSLGAYLRRRRESLGLSIEDIVRTTRVAGQHLKAMEEERWEELPQPVFAKGFIRAYCQALGEPPDDALKHYLSIQDQQPSSVLTPSWGRQPQPVASTFSISIVLIVLLGLGLAGISVFFQGKQDQPAPPQSVQSNPLPVIPEPALSSSDPLAPSPLEAVPSPQTTATPAGSPRAEAPRSKLIARTTELTWVKVTTDDGQVVQELLPPGSVREWTSSKRFVLTVGNAGGIALEYNGRPLPALGPSGAVVHDFVVPGPSAGATP